MKETLKPPPPPPPPPPGSGSSQRWTSPACKRTGSADRGGKRKLESSGESAAPAAAAKRTRRIKSLHEEFDDIIQSAQSSVGMAVPKPVSKGKGKSKWCASSTSPPQPLSPTKELRVQLVDIQTVPSPVRSNPTLSKLAIDAPSPIMPPVPRVVCIAGDEESAPPSPQSSCSEALKVHIKEEPQDEDTFIDASDTSLIESGQGLDLDNLIEDIFVKEQAALQECDEIMGSVPLTPPIQEEIVSTNSISVATVSSDNSSLPCSSILSISQDKPTSSNETSASTHHNLLAHPLTSQFLVEDTDAVNSGKVPGDEDAGVLFVNVTEDLDQLTPPQTTLSTTEPNEAAESASKDDKFLDEDFHEDLSLSNSQFLEIDAKCSLLEKIPPTPIAELKVQSPKNIVPDSSEGDIVTSPKRPPFVELVVPPAPSMDWIKKNGESHQRLKTLIQQISRLNAMIIRARRVMWPRKESTQQQARPANNQDGLPHPADELLHHGVVLPNLSQDPDWNLI